MVHKFVMHYLHERILIQKEQKCLAANNDEQTLQKSKNLFKLKEITPSSILCWKFYFRLNHPKWLNWHRGDLEIMYKFFIVYVFNYEKGSFLRGNRFSKKSKKKKLSLELKPISRWKMNIFKKVVIKWTVTFEWLLWSWRKLHW